MRLFLWLALVFHLSVAGCEKQTRPLATVPQVDLAKYAGTWYEVARLPNSFQQDDSSATAEYTLRADGMVGVKNTETRPDGSQKVAEGTAIAVAGSGNARLKVRFGGIASLVPVPESGNYWIIGLKPDYSAAMVGTPDRKFLWILMRDAKAARAEIDAWLQKAKDLGYPVERVIRRRL